ncbi:MAG: FHA domain-containing protein [Anaerolineae bacterium]|nr:FHA domain-containing protein [Anaerolineae bacterium]
MLTEGVLLGLRLLMALLLYAFLGIAFGIMWRDLQKGESHLKTQPQTAYLIIEEGDEVGKSVQLRSVTGIGRAEDNTIVLQDPFTSSHHALIMWREEQWCIEDLGSHNGTLVNDEQLVESQILATGDHIYIGQTLLRFESDVV